MKIGFIGLGQMGRGMALNLYEGLRGDKEFMVYDQSLDATKFFSERGINIASSLKDFYDCEILFLCLPNEDVVEEVLIKSDLISHMEKGSIVVDCSTIHYLKAKEFAAYAKDLGVFMIDAPVSGMQKKAQEGTLSIMCGGDGDTFQEVVSYLNSMGKDVNYLGPSGSGQLMKTINNVLYNINCCALSEILAFAVKQGILPEKLGDVLNAGTAQSYAGDYFIPRILERDFMYGFSLDQAYKDMKTALELSREQILPMPMLSASNVIYQLALQKGLGKEYKGSFVKIYEDWFDVLVKKHED